MSLKWGNEKLKGIAKPIPTAAPDCDWIFWLAVAACSLAGLGYFIWQVM